MSSDIILVSPNDGFHRLQERISDLEQELSNTRRLHVTIERNTRLFEALIASSQDGIALTRLDGIIIRVIRSVAGWRPSDVAGTSVFDLIHPDDQGQMRECYRQIAEKQVAKVSEDIRMVRPDGSAMRVTGSITDMLDDPAVQAIVHNYRAVPHQPCSEWEAVIEQAPFAAFSEKITGEILTWNRGASEMLGYDAGEIVGRSASVLTPPEYIGEDRQHRERVIAGGPVIPTRRTVWLRKDGTRVPVVWNLCLLLSGGRVESLVNFSFPRKEV